MIKSTCCAIMKPRVVIMAPMEQARHFANTCNSNSRVLTPSSGLCKYSHTERNRKESNVSRQEGFVGVGSENVKSQLNHNRPRYSHSFCVA